MGLFDPSSPAAYPRSWREMSFEYRGMFVYHIAMMAMFATGLLPIPFEFAVAGVIVLVVAVLSLSRRRRLGWQRPPIGGLDMLKALGVLAAAALFEFVALQAVPLDNPRIIPWFLAGVGIGLFGVLRELKLVAFSEIEFLAMGKPAATPAVEAVSGAGGGGIEPSWHRPARGIYRIAFFAVWLTFLAFFYVDSSALRDGAPQPTATATAPLTDHGRTVYVTPERADLVGLLMTLSFIGIPAVLICGFALQLAGANVFPGGRRIFGRRFDGNAG